MVATQAEAARLFVEVVLLDAGTLEPITKSATLRLVPKDTASRGLVLLHAVAGQAGVYRSADAWPPGEYTIGSACPGYQEGEIVARLTFQEEPQKARLLLDPDDG